MAQKKLELVFRADDLADEGRAFGGELSVEELEPDLNGLVGELGYRPLSPAQIEGTVYRSGADEVIVDGRSTLKVGFSCARCLQDREMTISVRADHVLTRKKTLDIKGAEDDEPEVMLDEDLDSPDEETFEGDEIDMRDLFRQDLIIEMPMNPTCEDAGCKCVPLAGKSTAGEAEMAVDPRWAPLLEMKKKMESE